MDHMISSFNLYGSCSELITPAHMGLYISQQAALKGTISLGTQEKRKDQRTQKSGSGEKVVYFISASLYPATKWEAVTQGGPGE